MSTFTSWARSLAKDLGQGLLQLIYPGICGACGISLTTEESGFCTSCRSLLIADPHETCPRCTSTIGPFTNLEDGCPHCRDSVFHFERAYRLGPYDDVLREVVLQMKMPSGEMVAEQFADLWAEQMAPRVSAEKAEAVAPVPLHWRRRWWRGFNQSETLARALARRLRIPCVSRCLRRSRPTPLQTQQTPAGRRENVRGAFLCASAGKVRGKTVLLVDDVLTTGSTCSEAARALRTAGAKRVVVAVVAHHRPY